MLGLDIAYMHAKFDHSSFSRSGDMVGAHENLNSSRDLTRWFVNLKSCFEIRENELDLSCCLRSGPRSDVACASVCKKSKCTAAGVVLPWVDELGVFILRSRTFKCSLDHALKSFYRSSNYTFGKVGRVATEKVVLQLISSKCIPV